MKFGLGFATVLAAGCIGAVNATVCDAGFYLKASKCATCPRGHKCDGSVRVRCKGFAPQVVSGDYIPMFQDEAGKTQCKECAACPNGAVRKNCHRASPGYCEPCPGGNTRATRFACTPCPAGTYAPSSLTCLPCQPGRFAQKGAALCSSCAPGTYTHLQKQHSCTACDGWSHGTGPDMASHPRAGGTVCSAHTVCKAKQWETKPATRTSDRRCTAHSACAANEAEAFAAGPHHDRECGVAEACSHVTCRHEHHFCPAHKTFQKLVSQTMFYTRGATAPPRWMGQTNCDRPQGWWSIRVHHHGAETMCKRGHFCGMTGDKCACSQLYPDRPDTARCDDALAGHTAPGFKSSCKRLCTATGNAAACAHVRDFVDTVRPQLATCAPEKERVSPWKQWSLCQASATDNIDGDITRSVHYDVTRLDGPNGSTKLCSNCLYFVAARILAKPTAGKYLVTMEACDAAGNCADGARAITFTANVSQKTCASLGSSFKPTASSSLPSQPCAASFCSSAHDNRTWDFMDAQRFCAAKGARLCTFQELSACENCGSVCDSDEELVWTSAHDGCNAGSHVTEVGRPSGKAASQRRCTSDGESIASLRCCADANAN